MFGRVFTGGSDSEVINEAAILGVRELAVIIENGKKVGLNGQRDMDQLVLTALSTAHGLSMLVSGGFLGELADSDGKVRSLGHALFEIQMQGMLLRYTLIGLLQVPLAADIGLRTVKLVLWSNSTRQCPPVS